MRQAEWIKVISVVYSQPDWRRVGNKVAEWLCHGGESEAIDNMLVHGYSTSFAEAREWVDAFVLYSAEMMELLQRPKGEFYFPEGHYECEA
jgi:hypothetical protein